MAKEKELTLSFKRIPANGEGTIPAAVMYSKQISTEAKLFFAELRLRCTLDIMDGANVYRMCEMLGLTKKPTDLLKELIDAYFIEHYEAKDVYVFRV